MNKNIARFLVIFALSSVAFAHSVTLHWTPGAPPTAVIDHFKIYRSSISGGPYNLMGAVAATQLSFTNGSNPDGTALQEGANFCYVVTAISGNSQSLVSNEVCVTIPVTPATPVQSSPDVQ